MGADEAQIKPLVLAQNNNKISDLKVVKEVFVD